MTAYLESDGSDIFVVVNGKRIAKRQARAWVHLEPGYIVRSCGGRYGLDFIEIEAPGRVTVSIH